MFLQTEVALISSVMLKLGLGSPFRANAMNRFKDCDLVISCSDENFKEAASLLPLNIYWAITWWSILFERTLEISFARTFGKPVIMFPNSVGPFRTWVGRFLSRLSLNSCNRILIRDSISYKIVESLGIRSPSVLTSDTALLYDCDGDNQKRNLSHPTVAVCAGIYSNSLLAREVFAYISHHARALDLSIEEFGFDVVFLPHYVTGFECDDFEISKLIVQKMKNRDRARIFNLKTVNEFKSMLNQMDMLISSKMHPAILGTSGYVPTLCIAYDHKQVGFFERLGMADCIIPIRELSSEGMLSKIRSVWTNREDLKISLQRKIPELQESVTEAIKSAMSPFLEE
jgi:colanic acid/amylovoran biosynthesis protein